MALKQEKECKHYMKLLFHVQVSGFVWDVRYKKFTSGTTLAGNVFNKYVRMDMLPGKNMQIEEAPGLFSCAWVHISLRNTCQPSCASVNMVLLSSDLSVNSSISENRVQRHHRFTRVMTEPSRLH